MNEMDNAKVQNEEAKYIQLMPLVDIMDGEEGITMWFEVPGANSGSVNIEVKDDVMNIVAHSSLRRGGRKLLFKRGFRLEEGTDPEKIAAKTSDGVLTLCIPKSERARVHRIKVG